MQLRLPLTDADVSYNSFCESIIVFKTVGDDIKPIITASAPPNTICFFVDGNEILRIDSQGFFWRRKPEDTELTEISESEDLKTAMILFLENQYGGSAFDLETKIANTASDIAIKQALEVIEEFPAKTRGTNEYKVRIYAALERLMNRYGR